MITQLNGLQEQFELDLDKLELDKSNLDILNPYIFNCVFTCFKQLERKTFKL